MSERIPIPTAEAEAEAEEDEEYHTNKLLYEKLEVAKQNTSIAKANAAVMENLRDARRMQVAAKIVEILKGRGGKIEDARLLIENLSPFISEKDMEFFRSEEMMKMLKIIGEYEENEDWFVKMTNLT